MTEAQILDGSIDRTVTAILTVWKRDNLEEQIQTILGQTVKPDAIWVYQCKDFVDVKSILRKFPQIEHIHSSVNLKYFGRFSLAQFALTKYVWIIDDDLIPSACWLENALKMCERENAIVSSAGRIIPKGDYFPEQQKNMHHCFFGDVPDGGSINFCKQNTIVDFGCNGWFFKTDWLKYFWSSSPYTLDTAEDMHLSALCKIKGDIRTIVPRQVDEQTTGNLKIEYGRDLHASWIKQDFLAARSQVLHYLIDELKWVPLMWDPKISDEGFKRQAGNRSGSMSFSLLRALREGWG